MLLVHIKADGKVATSGGEPFVVEVLTVSRFGFDGINHTDGRPYLLAKWNDRWDTAAGRGWAIADGQDLESWGRYDLIDAFGID
jgi:hypothetical protein